MIWNIVQVLRQGFRGDFCCGITIVLFKCGGDQLTSASIKISHCGILGDIKEPEYVV